MANPVLEDAIFEMVTQLQAIIASSADREKVNSAKVALAVMAPWCRVIDELARVNAPEAARAGVNAVCSLANYLVINLTGNGEDLANRRAFAARILLEMNATLSLSCRGLPIPAANGIQIVRNAGDYGHA